MTQKAAKVDQDAVTAGYRALALEVLQAAVMDAKGHGAAARSARAWLARDGLAWFSLAGLGVQPGAFRSWLEALPPVEAPPAWRAGVIGLLCEVARAYEHDNQRNTF